MAEVPKSGIYKDVRIMRIGGGTSEIPQTVNSGRLLDEGRAAQKAPSKERQGAEMVSKTGRNLYTRDELMPLVRPQSIAIVGLSRTGQGFGSQTLSGLKLHKYPHPLYTVAPRFSIEAAPDGAIGVASISDLPQAVDLVIVAVPAKAVVDVVAEAAARGCRAALVFSSGFGETADGAEDEVRLREVIKATGIKVGGPNTAGLLNYIDSIPLTFVGDLNMHLPSGNLGIVSQSGGIATHLGHRRNAGLGVSYMLSAGNSVDVNVLDYANFLLDDATTDVIVAAIEGIQNPTGLRQLGAHARRVGKPVLMLKCGRTARGGQAAISHTGSLAGSYDVFLAAADEAGIIIIDTLEQLIETGTMFAKWAKRSYRPGGVAVLSTMGGPAVMSADAADDYDVDLPEPSPMTREALQALMPSFAAISNPVDTTAAAVDPEMLRKSLEILADDPAFSAVMMLNATTTGASTATRPGAIAAAAANVETPICSVWLSTWGESPDSLVLDRDPNVPQFRSINRAMRGVKLWLDWHERAACADMEGEAIDAAGLPASVEGQIATIMDRQSVSGLLDEFDSRDVVDALRIRSARASLATSAQSAVAAAKEIGFPVVAKIVSPDIAHKAAVGGVKVGVPGAEALSTVFDTMMREVAANCPTANLRGVLIAEMVRGGKEFMCGVVRDATFGPVVLCGAGGGAVEELGDVARCVTPVSLAQARRAVTQLRLFRRMQKQDADQAARIQDALADVMVKLSQLAITVPQVSEVDINPLVMTAAGEFVALDALVVVGAKEALAA
jgi:acyl-CoA synthetase (NDP forming)